MKNSILRLFALLFLLLLGSSFSSLAQSNGVFVTAFLTGDGQSNLKLASWNLAADGSVSRLDEFTAGQASYVSLTRMGTTNMLATLIIDSSGNYKVITWQVLNNGAISRLSEVSLGEVSQVDLVSYGNNMLVTAMRDNQGSLRLITWSVASSGGALTRLGTGTAGAISVVRIQRIANSSLFVTAVRDGSGNLMLISWDVNASSGELTRRGDASAGAVISFSLDSYLVVPNMTFMTLIQNSTEAKIIYWQLANNGTITRLSDYTIGQASAISSFLGSDGRYMTAIRNQEGNLQVNAWRVDLTNNNQISNWGSTSAGAIAQVVANSCADSVVAVMSDADNNLRLIRWSSTANNDYSQITMNRLGTATGGSVGRIASEAVCMG